MSEGNNINEVKALLPKVVYIYHKYVQLLKENKVPIDELTFTKRLSKDSRDTVESNALTKLNSQGKYLKAERFCKMLLQTTTKIDLKTIGQFQLI
jgi:hypothetical protein